MELAGEAHHNGIQRQASKESREVHTHASSFDFQRGPFQRQRLLSGQSSTVSFTAELIREISRPIPTDPPCTQAGDPSFIAQGLGSYYSTRIVNAISSGNSISTEGEQVKAPEMFGEILDKLRSNRLRLWNASLLLIFLILDSARIVVDSWALKDHGEAAQPLIVMQSAFSIVVGLLCSACLGGNGGMSGYEAVKKALNPRAIFNCFHVAVCFCLSHLTLARAYVLGFPAATSIVLGNLYLPGCALLSRWFFGRRYGWLECIALAELSLASLTFAELYNLDHGLIGTGESGHVFILSTWALSITSTMLSCFASLAAEKILKRKYTPEATDTPFYIQKVQLQVGQFVAALIVLCFSSFWLSFQSWPNIQENPKIYLAILLRSAQGWMAGYLTKTFSTVSKAFVKRMSLLVIYFFGEEILVRRQNVIPSTMQGYVVSADRLTVCALAFLVFIVPVIYEMGRSISIAREAHEQSKIALPSFGIFRSLGILDGSEDQRGVKSEKVGILDGGWLDQVRTANSSLAVWLSSTTGLASQLLCVFFFIFADAGRTMTKEWFWRQEEAKSMTPQTVVLAGSLTSVCLGSIVSLILDGFGGFRRALSFSDALHCLPVAACFSIAQTCSSLSFSYGIKGIVSTVVGYLYMPLTAVLTKMFFGRSHTTLEWLALLLIMISAFVFVELQTLGKHLRFAYGQTGDISGDVGDDTSDGLDACLGIAVLFGLCSVVFASMGSLAAEKIMKASDNPYYQQKTNMDLGCLLTAFIMLFVIGSMDARTDLQKQRLSTSYIQEPAFWKKRERTDGTWGICPPAGWGWEAIVNMFVELVHAWMGGLVAKRLSSVVKTVAQAVSLLLVYFIGELVIKDIPFWWPIGSMAFVMALSVLLFTNARLLSPAPPRYSDT